MSLDSFMGGSKKEPAKKEPAKKKSAKPEKKPPKKAGAKKKSPNPKPAPVDEESGNEIAEVADEESASDIAESGNGSKQKEIETVSLKGAGLTKYRLACDNCKFKKDILVAGELKAHHKTCKKCGQEMRVVKKG
jgi:hypothetical protein